MPSNVLWYGTKWGNLRLLITSASCSCACSCTLRGVQPLLTAATCTKYVSYCMLYVIWERSRRRIHDNVGVPSVLLPSFFLSIGRDGWWLMVGFIIFVESNRIFALGTRSSINKQTNKRTSKRNNNNTESPMPDHDPGPRMPDWDNEEELDPIYDSYSSFAVSPLCFSFDRKVTLNTLLPME